ncbi:MAG: ligase-associated DNA damage response endonuclease PdeM [Pseudomonadota bacterium]|nr:ligase-associated DNA damage response endonuclease PdeM [Pseudomonadota bacterium]
MASSMRVELAGETVELHGARAMFWPRRKRLLMADLHLGKADIFRRAGIGLPRGGTTHDLDRLSALIGAACAQELWILGDVLHGAALDSAWRAPWEAWRARHRDVYVAALSGNHYRALASAGLDIELLGPGVEDAGFALRHEPASHTDLHVICGHLHPVITVPGIRKRFPCFWSRDGMTVLPAFSEFTGGYRFAPAPADQIVACVEGDTVMVQSGARAKRDGERGKH